MTIAVVSHDAGSSELLCALISRHLHDVQWHIFALPNSPMAAVCQRLNLSFSLIGDVQQLEIPKPDALFFGTGWQDKIERPFVEHCKKNDIPTVAFLDHWSNYRERFGYPDSGWEKNCGDFTAVHDEKALSLATTIGLPNPLALPNLYLQKLIEDVSTKTITPNQNLLFLSEPTDAVAKATYGDVNYWGFTQYSALEDILQNFENFGCAGLTIRLHPSETGVGFKKITKKYSHIHIQINDAKTFDLTDQLLGAKVIIGFDTMALYTAALMNKQVISYLPSPNRKFLLPLTAKCQKRTLTNLKLSTLTDNITTINNFGMDFALLLQTVLGKG